MVLLSRDDVWMVELDGSCGLGAVPRRRRRSAEERWRVVEETFEVGASVARVALKHGVNANQVCKRVVWAVVMSGCESYVSPSRYVDTY